METPKLANIQAPDLTKKDPGIILPPKEKVLSDTLVKEPKSQASKMIVPSPSKDEEEEEVMEIVPLISGPIDIEKLANSYNAQQSQILTLKQELASYKHANDKKLHDHLFDRFEGIKKHEVMTQFACKWFGILMIAHAIFYYFYFILRKGTQLEIFDDDTVVVDRNPVEDGIMQVSMYSMAYLFIVFFDIFWYLVSPDKVRCERTTAHTHVIVAAHRAHDSLREMLPTVLQTFSPECVWVADNGYRDTEAEALCQSLGVNYEYNEVGNKANALVVVARKIKRLHGSSVKNVVLLDDDTQLAADFFIRHDHLAREDVGGYCVGIAVNRSPPMNVWEIAIDYEYRAISHSFGARATCSTLPFCHGICAVYKLDLMIEMYSKNWSLPGGLPFGEDGYSGLDFRIAGYNLLQDNANVVLTYCPRRFFPPIFTNGRVQGYGASSLWKQRACRWFLSWPRQLPSEIWLFFFYNAGTWYGNIQYRVYFFWWLFLNCVSVGWIPYMFYVWLKHESWMLVLLLKGMLTATGILAAVARILSFPPKLCRGVHPLAPLCSPVLGMANAILRFFGFLFSLYWFIPFYRVNNLRVLGDDEPLEPAQDVEADRNQEDPTEEPTETEGGMDLVEGNGSGNSLLDSAERTNPWVKILRENMARHESSDDEPSAAQSEASFSDSASERD